MKTFRVQKSLSGVCQRLPKTRKGAILVLSAFVLTIILTFAAFTVDFGMITVTKGQIQNAADSAAHAAALELSRSFGPGSTVTAGTAATNARTQAVDMVARFRTGNLESTAAIADRDVRLGRRVWNSGSNSWQETWGVSPFNIAEVTVRRTAATNSALPMTFTKLFGVSTHNIEGKAVAGVAPAVGFRRSSNQSSFLGILPIAVDLPTWDQLVTANANDDSSVFKDLYAHTEGGVSVSRGSDGILEMNIYPDQNANMPSGNRGTVDLGSPNNSTNDLKRQITQGLNAYDLSFFPNSEIRLNNDGNLFLNGDTGISAGIEASLKQIIGHPRSMPIFASVSGPGNNAVYRIVKFVGIRIVAVELSGGPGRRHVTIQPAQYTDGETIIRGDGPIQYDSIVSKPFLIR